MVQDFTTGKPIKLLLKFYIPAALCSLLQQVYNVADSMIVGRMVSANALAAVSATGSVSFLFLGFLSGISIGCAIPVSANFGAKHYDLMRRYAANAVWFSLFISLLLSAVTIPFTDGILRLMNFPEDIMEYSRQYLIVTFAGTVCLAFYNLTANLLRAVGDSRTPLISLMIATVMNITLNILFVKMGLAVIGVALATMIAQLFSALYCTAVIKRKIDFLFPKKDEWRPNLKLLRQIVTLSLPVGLQSSVIGIGIIAVQRAINGLGTLYVAGFSAGSKVQQLIEAGLMQTLGDSMNPYSAQNIGAGKPERVRSGVRAAWLLMIPVLALAAICFVFFGSNLASMFIRADEAGYETILSVAGSYLRTISTGLIFLASIYIFRACIQGMGYSVPALLGALLELAARVIIPMLLVKPFGAQGINWANPMAWVAAGIMFPVMYLVIMRKLKKRFNTGARESLPEGHHLT